LFCGAGGASQFGPARFSVGVGVGVGVIDLEPDRPR
jgi:hypothetical protein